MKHGWNTDRKGNSETRCKGQPRRSPDAPACHAPIRVNPPELKKTRRAAAAELFDDWFDQEPEKVSDDEWDF